MRPSIDSIERGGGGGGCVTPKCNLYEFSSCAQVGAETRRAHAEAGVNGY